MTECWMSFKLYWAIIMLGIYRYCLIVQIYSSWLIKQLKLDSFIRYILIWITNSFTSKVRNLIHIIPYSIKIKYLFKACQLINPIIFSSFITPIRKCWFSWPYFTKIHIISFRTLYKVGFASIFISFWINSYTSINYRNVVSLILMYLGQKLFHSIIIFRNCKSFVFIHVIYIWPHNIKR